MNEKLALFDFCETLVSFQTADAFVDFVRSKTGNAWMNFLERILVYLKRLRIIVIFNRFLRNYSFEKRVKLLQLKGLSYHQLNRYAGEYYHEIIKPNLISPVLDEMQNLVNQRYELCLVSGAYYIYLYYFAEENKIKHVISTEITYKGSGKICCGTISGKDCREHQKVKRILTYFNDRNIDWKDSISYSDSLTDLPLLQFTGTGVVVSQDQSQSWVKHHNLTEIVWHKK